MSDKDPNNSDDLKKILEENLKKFQQKTGKGSSNSESSSTDNSSNSNSNSQQSSSNSDRDNRSSSNNSSSSSSSSSNFEENVKNQFNNFKKKFFNRTNNSNNNRGSSNNGGSNSSSNFKAPKGMGLGLGLGVVLVLGAIVGFKGFYTVNESENGVVTLLGAYHETTQPGLNWKVPFLEDVTIVNIQQVRQLHIGGVVLTKDANLVNVSMNIQYRIANPVDYLFNVESPIPTLEKASEAALRYTIGHMDMNSVLTTGRSLVRSDTLENLETTLKPYNMGIEIVDVNFQYARPPEQVKAAFDDAIKAQEDEERFKREASAYQLAQLPIARGQAQQINNQAQAYAKEEVFKAEGAQIEFNQLLPQYQAQPLIFKQRYFLTTMASILKNTPKIIVDKGVNLNFLSLDSLFKQSLQATKTNNSLDNGKLLKLNQSTKTSGVPVTGNLNTSSLDQASSISSTQSNSSYSNNSNYSSNDYNNVTTNSNTNSTNYSNDSYSNSTDTYNSSTDNSGPSRFNQDSSTYSSQGGK